MQSSSVVARAMRRKYRSTVRDEFDDCSICLNCERRFEKAMRDSTVESLAHSEFDNHRPNILTTINGRDEPDNNGPCSDKQV